MRFYTRIISTFLLLLTTTFGCIGQEYNSERAKIINQIILFNINNGHYNPSDLDDDLSVKAFDEYMKMLDFSKRFLIQEDIDQMSPHKTEIDDQFKATSFELFDLSVGIIEQRIKEAKSYYGDVLDKPLDYNKSESYNPDPEARTFSTDKDELKERWRKQLKYEIITRVSDEMKGQEEAAKENDTVTVKTFEELEKEARKSVKKRYDDWFHRLEKVNKEDRFASYLNAVLMVFDPHTNYFPPKDKEDFDIRFSGQLEGIGAQLIQKNAYVEVHRIIPGGPAWKQGELEVGDHILKVGQEDEEPIDIVDMRLDKAVQLIRGKKGTEVKLTIKKIDGTIKVLPIVRDVVMLEETFAKSAILEDKDGQTRVGYLKLPSFYVDFNHKNGRSCTEDVANEIEKLKKENVDGIVFDLRDNGGGSLPDVVNIAGLFIEDGPVVQVKGRFGRPIIRADKDKDIHYDGPLLVMVNSTSASASEIFAAAIQDYERGLVLGSQSTFGKGTVQNFNNLDRFLKSKPDDLEELGSLKMTTQKFYRINGDATQLKGVTSDIIIPDYYAYLDIGERDRDHPLPWDEIDPVSYEKWNSTYDFDEIIASSMERIENDSIFNLVDENAKRLKKLRDESIYNLDYDTFLTEKNEREELAEKYKNIGKDTLGIKVITPSADIQLMEQDTAKMERIKAWHTSIKKDIYLEEALNVMSDIEGIQRKVAKEQ